METNNHKCSDSDTRLGYCWDCGDLREEKHKEYVAMWDAGKFGWNDNIKNPINPERIWQVFIEPLIDSFTAKVEEAREEGRKSYMEKAYKTYFEEAKREWVERVREWAKQNHITEDMRQVKMLFLNDLNAFLDTL